MTIPNVSESRTIAEYTDTTGTGDYNLLGALPSCFRFRDAHLDGDSFDYIASDGPNIEIVTGTITFGSPDTLSRDIIQGSSNDGNPVDWSGVTRPFIHEVGSAGAVTSTREWFVSFSFGGTFSDMNVTPFDGNYEIFSVESPSGWDYILYDLTNSATPGCEIAPLTDVNLPLQVISPSNSTSTHGFLTILAGQVLGSYTGTSGTISVSSGYRLRLSADSTVDDTISGIYGTISGTRANF